jgi:hypothetical protein
LTIAERRERREEMARKREARFQRRKLLLEADPYINPRVRELYLDRTLVNGIEAAKVLGLESPQRIYSAKSRDRMDVRVPPHPSAYMDIDKWEKRGACVELGRLREWAEKSRHYVMRPDTGELVKGRIRHGRERAPRTNRGKVQIPGTPRKDRRT